MSFRLINTIITPSDMDQFIATTNNGNNLVNTYCVTGIATFTPLPSGLGAKSVVTPIIGDNYTQLTLPTGCIITNTTILGVVNYTPVLSGPGVPGTPMSASRLFTTEGLSSTVDGATVESTTSPVVNFNIPVSATIFSMGGIVGNVIIGSNTTIGLSIETTGVDGAGIKNASGNVYVTIYYILP